MFNVSEVHYEITDRCNAGCPQCVRTNPEGCKSWDYLSNQECSLESFRKYSPPAFLKTLKFIYFCGNYGDPLFAKDLIEILEYCYLENPQISIKVHSNCGLRTVDWWMRLAHLTKEKKFMLVASIDGATEEIQKIYRVGVNPQKVFANLKAFIEAGGRAQWRYILFKHNEHELKLAQQLSNDLGFKEFRYYSSTRFFGAEKFHYSQGGESKSLEPSSHFVQKFKFQKTLHPDLLHPEEQKEKIKISCYANKTQSVFIDSEGYILPCCHLGIRSYTYNREVRDVNGDEQIYALFDSFDIQRLNVNIVGFEGAFQGCREFLSFLEKHWENNQPYVCKMICGEKR